MTSSAGSALTQRLFAQRLGGLSCWPRPLDIVEVEILTLQSWKALLFFFFSLQKSFTLTFKGLFVGLSVLVLQNGVQQQGWRVCKEVFHLALQPSTIFALSWHEWFIFKNSLH